MADAIDRAKKFLSEEQAFRLGQLLTESSHPKTVALSETVRLNVAAGIRLLQSVDEEILPAAERIFQQENFQELVDAFLDALKAHKRIYFVGCGATGRLSILLEAAWRRFWQDIKQNHPGILVRIPDMEDRTFSVMAGGDFALIKSVEGFEDFQDFGRFQLKQTGVQTGDIVIAITEGGETPFVIGAAWQGLDAGAKVFFVYNNPTDILRSYVQRSRQIIDQPRVTKLDLTTGPMAIIGSTRMQAVTAELLIIGSALESALIQYLQKVLSPSQYAKSGFCFRSPKQYHQLFVNLLKQLSTPDAVDT